MINVLFNDYKYDLVPKKKETYEKYCKILKWGRQNPVAFIETFMNIQLLDHQKYVFLSSWTPATVVWLMSRSSGKAEVLYTPIYKQINKDDSENFRYEKVLLKDIKQGDYILGGDGKPTKVIKLNPIVIEDSYEITFDDGTKIRCNKEHLWNVEDVIYNKRHKTPGLVQTVDTEFMSDKFWYDGRNRFKVPNIPPIEYSERKLPLEPYLMGLFLGDGSKNTPIIYSDPQDVEIEKEILENINNYNGFYYVIDNPPSITKEKLIRIRHKNDVLDKNGKVHKSVYCDRLRELGVFNNKHIPNIYKYCSVQQRLDLLAGLFDSDGYASKIGHQRFIQKDKQMAYDVKEILESLGARCTISWGKSSHAYEVQCSLDGNIMPLFKLPRKLNRQKQIKKPTYRKAIIKIEKTNQKESMRCITVDNDTGTFVCGDNPIITHNSYLTSPFIMARSLLIPNHNTYIMAPAGNQAQLNFQKLEDLAKGQIASVLGVSSFFLDECVRLNAKADPFTHSKQSYTVGLYNGSTINTLNSVAKNIVGVRSNLSVFDEAGKIDRDFYALTEPFSVQDSSFVTGGNLNPELYPTQLPNKNLYLSSAEGQDSHLFDMYKRGFERMLHGDPDYFVCDLDCQLSLHPFLCGKPTKPLVSQQTIDDAFATNKYRAQREYYNLWDNDSGPNAFIKKSTINKYTQVYWPILENEGEKHYIILYDPASKNDNSFVLVCEMIKDEERGLMLKLVYARNLVEPLANGQKAHIQKPEQVEILKELLLKYNLTFDDYEGIDILCIDAGAGGGGFDVGQYIMNDWHDSKGNLHKGWIDPEDPFMSLRLDDYIGNCQKLKMFNFKRDKVTAYERTQNAINQGLVIFPASMNVKNELEFPITTADGREDILYEKAGEQELGPLLEFDRLKDEIVSMQKIKGQNNNLRFETSPEGKSRGVGDDRADCLAMACWYLMEARAKEALDVPQQESDFKDFFAKANKGHMNKNNNPFANTTNPFKNMTQINPFTK